MFRETTLYTVLSRRNSLRSHEFNMLSHIIAMVNMKWLFFLALPVVAHAEYLKSKGNIKVLEGKNCVLEWVAYTEEEYAAPCSWWYTPHRSEEALIFLAYEDGKRFEFGDEAKWRFTNVTKPCSGGLLKKVHIEDAGIYMMSSAAGKLKNKKYSETSLEVLKSSDLAFSVLVNDKERKFDLSGDLNRTLDLLETDSPVDISVVLSKAFPSTTVVTISNSEVSCNDPYKRCHQVIDLSDTMDVSIIISIETLIVGAEKILIIQPLSYYNKGVKLGNILCGVFITVLLIIIISMVVLYIRTNKKNVLMFCPYETDVERQNQQTEHKLKIIYDKAEHVISDMKQQIATEQESIESQIKTCYNCLDDILLSTSELLTCWKSVLNQMEMMQKQKKKNKKDKEKENKIEIIKTVLIQETEKLLNCIKMDCNRFKDIIQSLQREYKETTSDEVEEGEEVTEETQILSQEKDIQEQIKTIGNLGHQMGRLQHVSGAIAMIEEYTKEKQCLLKEIKATVQPLTGNFKTD